MNINKSDIEGFEICKRNKMEETILGIFMDSDDIPEWLLIEVLIRLDVKFIFGLKIVSKHWLSVISDPSFARMYISRASLLQQPWVITSRYMRSARPERSHFYQIESVESMYCGELKCHSYCVLHHLCPLEPRQENFKIYGISDGLVLCSEIVPNINASTIYSICNPVTRKWIVLPGLTCQFQNVHPGFVTRVEDGVLRSYRVVHFDRLSVKTKTAIFHVFFSESGEWNDFRVSSDLEIDCMYARPPTDLHGNLHWELCNGIVAYDPYGKPDDFRIIPLPRDKDQQPRGNGVASLCGVSDRKLRYILIGLHDKYQFSSLEIWILGDYNSGDWSLQNRVSRPDIIADAVLSTLNTFIFPISFDPFDSDTVYLGYTNIIVSYNIKTKRLRAHNQPRSMRRISANDPYFRVLPWWMGMAMMFLIPSWPTSIPISSFGATEKP